MIQSNAGNLNDVSLDMKLGVAIHFTCNVRIALSLLIHIFDHFNLTLTLAAAHYFLRKVTISVFIY